MAFERTILLAADKGAPCLTISAPDELADANVTHRLPGPLAMFSNRGRMVLLCGIFLLPVGFGIQVVDLKKIPFDSQL